LRPLILHQNQQSREDNQGPFIRDCVGISPGNVSTKKNIEIKT
ncbi:unnamed protein product, partial [Rotaria magnacalcarata]